MGPCGGEPLLATLTMPMCDAAAGPPPAVAAATTAAIRHAFAPPPVFRADRPFLSMTRAASTGDVVVLGRLVDPGGR
jgi:hypothetical protein